MLDSLIRPSTRKFLWQLTAAVSVVAAYFWGFRHGADEMGSVFANVHSAESLRDRSAPIRAAAMYILEDDDPAM